MKPPRLSPFGLRQALIAGSQRVMAHRAEINRINVFPVADGDTGTNLSLTLGFVWHELHGPAGRHAHDVLGRVAIEAIDHARGNSGAILAHYFQGAAEATVAGRPFTAAVLAQAAGAAAKCARSALAHPCEGTILSVMQAFADELQVQVSSDNQDLRACFGPALARAREALRQTTAQVPALRAAGVVDAGARGFVELLAGVADYIARGRAALRDAPPVELPTAGIEVAAGDRETAGHRACAECYITADVVDRAGLKTALLALPLSALVIEGLRHRVRVHAHLADPARLFGVAARFGTVSREQIEVASGDSPTAAARRRKVAIVTDSGADLPDEARAALDLHVVPVRLSIGGRDCVDGVSLTPREFYDAMRSSEVLPRTSQPPPGDFRRMFEHLLAHHEHVIDVSLGGNLSGALQSAVGAATRTDPSRIHVFDSRHAAGGLGLLAIWAAEAAQAGLDAPQILAGLARMRPRTALFGVIRDVRYGVRGGRVPRVALPLTRLLRVYPFARNKPDGRFGLKGGMWGRHRLPERFAHRVARQLDPARRYRVMVGHCDCAEDAERVRRTLLTRVHNLDRLWVLDAGVAIGAHAGPGSLLIGVQDYEPPPP